jgi:hypothetical protein
MVAAPNIQATAIMISDILQWVTFLQRMSAISFEDEDSINYIMQVYIDNAGVLPLSLSVLILFFV